jgi:hypothetical protein
VTVKGHASLFSVFVSVECCHGVCRCMPDHPSVLRVVQRSLLAGHVGCNYVGFTPFHTVCLCSGVAIVTLFEHLVFLCCLLYCQHPIYSQTGPALRNKCGAAEGSEIGHVLLVSGPY